MGDEAEGLLVAGAEHGGRPVFHGSPDLRREFPGFEVEVAGEDVVFVHGQTHGLQPGTKALQPGGGQNVAARASDVPDLGVAKVSEVADRLFRAAGVIDRDRGGREVLRIFTGGYHGHLRQARHAVAQTAEVNLAIEHHESIHPGCSEQTGMVEGPLSGHGALGDQHAKAIGSGDLLDACNDRREERVGQVRCDHADGVCPLLAQVAGRFIDHIAGPFDRLEHLPPRLFTDPLRVTQGAADRRCRYAGDAGNILDGGDFSFHGTGSYREWISCTNNDHSHLVHSLTLDSRINVPANIGAIVYI